MKTKIFAITLGLASIAASANRLEVNISEQEQQLILQVHQALGADYQDASPNVQAVMNQQRARMDAADPRLAMAAYLSQPEAERIEQLEKILKGHEKFAQLSDEQKIQEIRLHGAEMKKLPPPPPRANAR